MSGGFDKPRFLRVFTVGVYLFLFVPIFVVILFSFNSVKSLQNFDGFTPTFTHPNLPGEDLRFLLGAAYSRFYMRPSFLANYLGVSRAWARDVVGTWDRRVSRQHARAEIARMSRPVTC